MKTRRSNATKHNHQIKENRRTKDKVMQSEPLIRKLNTQPLDFSKQILLKLSETEAIGDVFQEQNKRGHGTRENLRMPVNQNHQRFFL